MSFRLSVNLNKVALLRNSRKGNNPSVLEFAKLALECGAQGLTAHPRPDQRHIRVSDLPALSAVSKQFGVEFNIEGNPFAAPRADYPGLLTLVEQNLPDQCTLVPDTDNQLTSDHGFDLRKDAERLGPFIKQLKNLGVRVSLFMDPDVEQIRLAKDCGADAVELYTGPFAWTYERAINNGKDDGSESDADTSAEVKKLFKQHQDAAQLAFSLKLGINAGHDLNLENMRLYRTLPGLSEVSIGHALTVDALKMGFENAIIEYLKLCE